MKGLDERCENRSGEVRYNGLSSPRGDAIDDGGVLRYAVRWLYGVGNDVTYEELGEDDTES